ncbi:MAG TPA: hypothetical protein VIY28_09670 [Pseudonocardiaceae bacterium]
MGLVRPAVVGAAALAVVGGVLGGCGREPATGGLGSSSPAPVTLAVASDVADEIQLHGYDLQLQVS